MRGPGAFKRGSCVFQRNLGYPDGVPEVFKGFRVMTGVPETFYRVLSAFHEISRGLEEFQRCFMGIP